MLYAVLKVIHLLSLMVWVGGMFFTLFCLRPALAALEPPVRVRLMTDVLRRFFAAVSVAAGAVLVSGAWMIASLVRTGSSSGVGFNMPLDLHVMLALGVLMMAIFIYIRLALFARLQRAAGAQQWPAAAAALASIRGWVLVNLVLGALIVVVTRLGAL
jgi:uncharacterized membrane protein